MNPLVTEFQFNFSRNQQKCHCKICTLIYLSKQEVPRNVHLFSLFSVNMVKLTLHYCFIRNSRRSETIDDIMSKYKNGAHIESNELRTLKFHLKQMQHRSVASAEHLANFCDKERKAVKKLLKKGKSDKALDRFDQANRAATLCFEDFIQTKCG